MEEQPFNLEEVVYKMDIKFLATAYKDLQIKIEDLTEVIKSIQDLNKIDEQSKIINELVSKSV